jgi:CheY-like chemotaxis protein
MAFPLRRRRLFENTRLALAFLGLATFGSHGGQPNALVLSGESRVYQARIPPTRPQPTSAEASALSFAARHLDLLFTDVVMPGISGLQLAANLTATMPDLPVIYASGYSDERIPGGTGDGHVSYLPKPFTARKLLLRVREVLDQREGAGPTPG